MEFLLGILTGAFMHHWAIITFALGLAAYQIAAARIKILPRLPYALLYLYFVLRFAYVSLPKTLDERIFRAIDAAAAIAIYWAAARLLFTLIVESWFKWRRKTKVPRITRDLFLAIAYALIFIVVLRTRGGVNLIGLITTSAVLTAVIGLAAQSTLGNIFSGLSIQMDHPFGIGDWVEYGNNTGKVIGIGWASTRLKTFDDEMIIVPNADIAKSVVKNHSLPTPRHAMKIDVGCEYGAPPERVRRLLLDVCDQEPRILKEPRPVIRVLGYGDFAITYQMRFFYNDFGISPDLRADVMNRIWYALRRAGIKIPYPIRDLHHRHIERKFEAEESVRLRARALADIDKVPILAPLSPDDRTRLAERLDIKEYGSGELIVRQGDPGDSLYILHRGACDVEVAAGGAPPAKVAALAPPSFFGEMSLLTGEPRSATVKSVGHVVVFSIDKEIFREVLAAHPEVSEELARALAKRHGETGKVVGKQIEEQDRQASRILNKIRSFFGLA